MFRWCGKVPYFWVGWHAYECSLSYYAHEDTLLSWGDSFRGGGEREMDVWEETSTFEERRRRESGVCVSWGTNQVGDSPNIQNVNDHFPQFSM